MSMCKQKSEIDTIKFNKINEQGETTEWLYVADLIVYQMI